MAKSKPWSPMKTNKSEDYWEHLTPEEQEFLRKFNYDYQYGGVYSKVSMLTTPEAVAEAKANHKAYIRDAFTFSSNKNLLCRLNENFKEFMDDVSDDIDWQTEYDRSGFVKAKLLIIEQAENDLLNRNINVKVTLLRYDAKLKELNRLYKRDRNNKRKQKGLK